MRENIRNLLIKIEKALLSEKIVILDKVIIQNYLY